MDLRVALFVEGSQSPPRRGLPPLEQIWNVDLPDALGIRCFDQIIPISKKHLVAMDPDMPPMSGAGEGLDQLMARMLERKPFDAAVVAWDLIPAWNPEADDLCRWEETLRFYELLGASDVLEQPWKAQASSRHHELSHRTAPSARQQLPQLQEHSIQALCMVPMFEELLVLDEGAVRRASGIVKQKRPKGWPTSGWGGEQGNHPDRVLSAAVSALRSMGSAPKVVKQVRGDMRNNKDGWGEFFLRMLLADEEAVDAVLGHPISVRLAELMR